MLKLYIDCDGVIIDSITTTYKLLEEAEIDLDNEAEVFKFFRELDWNQILKITPFLNDSINSIKKILSTNLFDIEILTHINSEEESAEKISYFKRILPEVNVITTKKEIAKCDAVDPKGAILIDDYLPNLILWHKKGGIPIKFSDSNKDCEYIKITSLEQVIELYDDIINKCN